METPVKAVLFYMEQIASWGHFTQFISVTTLLLDTFACRIN